jgi:deoxyribonuclease-4
MTKIVFGPSGLGPVVTAKDVLSEFKKNNLHACEIAFTYGVYIKEEDAKFIGNKAKELDVFLSIHAPYYINLNSEDKEKVSMSKKRILDCCEIAHHLGAKRVVFHAGFYGNDKETAFLNIKKRIEELLLEIKEKKWDVEICPEVMGKINVFGSIEEISRLVKETGCGCCIDFAHILARYNERKFEEVKKAFPNKKWHVHFSGINYGEKGEKNHIPTELSEWKILFSFLRNLNKDIVLICESPNPTKDSIEGRKTWEKETTKLEVKNDKKI